MFNLIRKDILLQKKTFNYILLFIIIFSLIMNNVSSESRYLMYGLVSVSSFILTTFAYDEHYKSDIILNSFPVNRKDIVLSKYISIIIYVILSIAIVILLCEVLTLLKLPINTGTLNFKIIMDIFSINFLVYSIGLLMIFKFGYNKGRRIFTFILFACMYMLMDLYSVGYIIFKNFSITMFLISIMVYSISLIISISIYENKDLA